MRVLLAREFEYLVAIHFIDLFVFIFNCFTYSIPRHKLLNSSIVEFLNFSIFFFCLILATTCTMENIKIIFIKY